MTDTTGGGRNGVGIRLFVEGGEVVKRTFGQIADSGKKMWAEIAMGEKAANPALRAVSRVSAGVQESIDGVASRAGTAGHALSAFGTAGVVAAVGLGALVIALGAVKGAIDAATQSAAELTDAADRIGVGVEELQAWRYVADEAGVGIENLEANLEKLNGTLGAFKLGIGDAKLKPIFEELGITKEQLQNVRTSDELMMLLADTLGQVKDRAEQVRLARGLGVEDSLPILRLGSEGVRRLLGDAEELGFVLDNKTVKSLDETDRALERAGQQMKVVRDTGVAPLAEALADAATYVAGLAVEFDQIEAKVPGWVKGFQALLRNLPGTGIVHRGVEFTLAQGVRNATGGRGVSRGGTPNPNRAATETVTAADMLALLGDAGADGGGFELKGHTPPTGGGGSSAAREAEQRRREQARAMEALAKAEESAQRDWIQTKYGPGGTLENEHDLALARVTLDREEQEAQREALRAQLEKAGALDETAKARLEELRVVQEELAKARDAAILRAEERELVAERVRSERARDQDAVDLLALDREMAESARERLEISRRILLLQQEIERKAMEAAADEDGRRTAEEQEALDRQAVRHGREIELFDHNAREDMRAEFQSYGREVADAIENGRIGEHIADELKAGLIDMALSGLFDFLYPDRSRAGAGGGDGGGVWAMAAQIVGSLFGVPTGPGRAGGGPLLRGTRHPIAETGRPELLMVGGSGQVTSAAETARLLQETVRAGAGANGGRIVVEQHIYPDFSGAVMTEDLVTQFNARIAASRQQAVGEAVDLVRKGAGPRQISMMKLGT